MPTPNPEDFQSTPPEDLDPSVRIAERVAQKQEQIDLEQKKKRLPKRGILETGNRKTDEAAAKYLQGYERLTTKYEQDEDGKMVAVFGRPTLGEMVQRTKETLRSQTPEGGPQNSEDTITPIEKLATYDACREEMMARVFWDSALDGLRNKAERINQLTGGTRETDDIILISLTKEPAITVNQVLPRNIADSRGRLTEHAGRLLVQHGRDLEQARQVMEVTRPRGRGATVEDFMQHSLQKMTLNLEQNDYDELKKKVKRGGFFSRKPKVSKRDIATVTRQTQVVLGSSTVFKNRIDQLNQSFLTDTETARFHRNGAESADDTQNFAQELVRLQHEKKYVEVEVRREMGSKAWEATKDRLKATEQKRQSLYEVEEQAQAMRQEVTRLLRVVEDPHDLSNLGFHLKHLTDRNPQTRKEAQQWLVEFRDKKAEEIRRQREINADRTDRLNAKVDKALDLAPKLRQERYHDLQEGARERSARRKQDKELAAEAKRQFEESSEGPSENEQPQQEEPKTYDKIITRLPEPVAKLFTRFVKQPENDEPKPVVMEQIDINPEGLPPSALDQESMENYEALLADLEATLLAEPYETDDPLAVLEAELDGEVAEDNEQLHSNTLFGLLPRPDQQLVDQIDAQMAQIEGQISNEELQRLKQLIRKLKTDDRKRYLAADPSQVIRHDMKEIRDIFDKVPQGELASSGEGESSDSERDGIDAVEDFEKRQAALSQRPIYVAAQELDQIADAISAYEEAVLLDEESETTSHLESVVNTMVQNAETKAQAVGAALEEVYLQFSDGLTVPHQGEIDRVTEIARQFPSNQIQEAVAAIQELVPYFEQIQRQEVGNNDVEQDEDSIGDTESSEYLNQAEALKIRLRGLPYISIEENSRINDAISGIEAGVYIHESESEVQHALQNAEEMLLEAENKNQQIINQIDLLSRQFEARFLGVNERRVDQAVREAADLPSSRVAEAIQVMERLRSDLDLIWEEQNDHFEEE